MRNMKEEWEVDKRIIGQKWNQTIFETLQLFFKEADYLYCYEIYTPNTISYVDFSLEKTPLRFAFFLEGKKIKWALSVKEGNSLYFKDFDHLNPTIFDKIVEKKKILIEMIKNVPSFRVKIALKEIEIDEGKRLNEKFLERMKEL